MRISIKTPMKIPEMPSEARVEQGSLLRDLLDRLLRDAYFAKEIVDAETGELVLDGTFQVLLNNVPSHSLPEGLATELHEGDVLTLTLILIGGG
jgi:hypothetical protein